MQRVTVVRNKFTIGDVNAELHPPYLDLDGSTGSACDRSVCMTVMGSRRGSPAEGTFDGIRPYPPSNPSAKLAIVVNG